ncbi:MAG: hypothetical protein JNM10_09330 [Planctomycetia bacterium]|nr:hypothetical protein [Planctomycetia bacterium]
MSFGIRRLLVLAVGAVMAVYGAASLTGGWLGTPPWWVVCTQTITQELHSDGHCEVRVADHAPFHAPRPWDAPVGAALTAAGLSLVAVGVWLRRRTDVES